MKALFLPAERAFLRYIEIPGEDPPLLWVHGWQCASTGELMSAAVRAPLRGRRSLLVDLLGHGYSDKPLDFAYTREAHARTIVALIDALELTECGLVGHSMGGAIATHVAATRQTIVSLLLLLEAAIDSETEDRFGGQTEDEFVERGWAELLAAHSGEADAQPAGLRAAHLGIERVAAPQAIHREGVSAMEIGTVPNVRTLLAGLAMPRWYFMGELSEPEAGEEEGLAAIGVGWRVVPATGHAMGIQNPEGVAQAIAEVTAESWGP